jgi:hypothetical protein
MSAHSDALSVCITDSRVFRGDTVSRVFVGDTVARFYMDAALEQGRRRVAELASETISGSDMVGGDRDGPGTAKRGGVYQRSSRPELADAEYHSGLTPGLDALASVVTFWGAIRDHGHLTQSRFRVGEVSVAPGRKRPRGYRYSHRWIDRDGRPWDQYIRVNVRAGTP